MSDSRSSAVRTMSRPCKGRGSDSYSQEENEGVFHVGSVE
jgi:hypothetical protein